MDTTKLVVGQDILIFGIGRLLATVVAVSPSGVDVQSDDGFMRFDQDGVETEASRCLRLGLTPSPEDPVPLRSGPPEWQPWEVLETSPEKIAAFKAEFGR